jgi:hypothetical protein
VGYALEVGGFGLVVGLLVLFGEAVDQNNKSETHDLCLSLPTLRRLGFWSINRLVVKFELVPLALENSLNCYEKYVLVKSDGDTGLR